MKYNPGLYRIAADSPAKRIILKQFYMHASLRMAGGGTVKFNHPNLTDEKLLYLWRIAAAW